MTASPGENEVKADSERQFDLLEPTHPREVKPKKESDAVQRPYSRKNRDPSLIVSCAKAPRTPSGREQCRTQADESSTGCGVAPAEAHLPLDKGRSPRAGRRANPPDAPRDPRTRG